MDSPWISVKTELPAEGMTVLVTEQDRIPFPAIAYIWKGMWRKYASMDEEFEFPISHWMRIPALQVDDIYYEISQDPTLFK